MVESASPIPEVADSLAMAIVMASEAPLLLLDDEVIVLAASASFCRAFDLDEDAVRGRHLSQLGKGEWDIPELNSLLEAAMSGMPMVGAYEADLIRSGKSDRRLALRAKKLAFADKAATRVLLTITDLTETRVADTLRNKLLHEKMALLQELQHRVANSLQIIASILMQSARRVRSEEVRSHLYEARSRVISICAIQQHLTAASLEDVEMRPYLTELCKSIAASLISNTDRTLSIEVSADGSSATADVSISLGLAVTEEPVAQSPSGTSFSCVSALTGLANHDSIIALPQHERSNGAPFSEAGTMSGLLASGRHAGLAA